MTPPRSHFLMSMRFSPKDSRTNFFSLSIPPSYVEAEAVDFSRFRFRFHIPGYCFKKLFIYSTLSVSGHDRLYKSTDFNYNG